MMKRLLRQGWVRAGVPVSSIESLADHSWSVSVLTYVFIVLENQIRASRSINSNLILAKGVFIALFHDFTESEYFDMDKSVRNLLSNEEFHKFHTSIEKSAISELLSKLPVSIEDILKDNESEEYHMVKVVDIIDLLNQANEYGKKHWLDEKTLNEFRTYALSLLKDYKKRFYFLEDFLESNRYLIEN